MHKLLLVIVLLVSLFIGGSARAEEILEVPVEFSVVNQNRSLVLCQADGKSYTIHGHLVAPASALAGPDSVGLYLHGATLGEFNWRFKDVPGYDTMAELAQLGHARSRSTGLDSIRAATPWAARYAWGPRRTSSRRSSRT